MIFWTAYTLILSLVASVISGIPLRASDLGRDGHIVHYHRDGPSGGHRRHIHHRPAVKRSHNTYRDTFFQKLGSAINPNAIYEVPSNRQYNNAHAGRMAIQLRSLVEKTFGENNNTSDVKSDNSDSGDNNGKPDNNYEAGIHSVQNRDAPTPPSEAHAHTHAHFSIQSLPHGLQFLNPQSQARHLQNPSNSLSDQSNRLTLDLNSLLGETVETTTPPSLTPSDVFMSTGSSLDLGFLLGGLGDTSGSLQSLGHQGHDHSHHVHSHGQDHGHGHHVQSHGHGGHNHADNSIHDKANDGRSTGRLGNFMGMFNQHPSHTRHVHQEVITPASTNTVPSRLFYQNSTQRARAITKRGVVDSDSVSRFPKTFIDNILNINIMRTTPPPPVVPTSIPTRYDGYLTTPRSIETQIERLSGIDLNRVRERNREFVRNTNNAVTGKLGNQATTMPEIVAPSQKELVHLQGIHLMFSDGRQDKSGNIPTVHLTAAVSDNINHMLQMASGSQQGPSGSSPTNTITDKITGTAVIRDGHLYLVVYPFGHNKSLEIHYNQTTKRIPLPHNKPVSFSDIIKTPPTPSFSPSISQSIKPTIQTKTVPATAARFSSVKPTVQAKVTSTRDLPASTRADLSSTSDVQSPSSHPEGSTNTAKDMGLHVHDHHHHGHHGNHHQHHHGSSTPSLTGLKLAEVNETTLQTLLAPIERFVSPWKSLNFSKVFPYSAGITRNKTSTKRVLEEDSEVDVVTFIAKATDPFNRMKDIIESLVNKTLINDAGKPNQENKTETRFNFELKLESGNAQNTNDKQPTTNPNNSEEKTQDTTVNLAALVSKTADNSNTFEQVTETMSTTTLNPFVLASQENSFTVGRSSGESVTSTKPLFDSITDDANLRVTTTSVPSGEFKTTTGIAGAPHRANTVDNQQVINSGSSNSLANNNFVSGIIPATVRHDVIKQTVESNARDRLLHAAENIAPSTSEARLRDRYASKTTLSYLPTYTKSTFEKQSFFQITTPSTETIVPDNRQTFQRNVPTSSLRQTILGSNLQPFVQRTSPNRFRQGLHRGQSEQIISLADILNDIRRIQLHNMQRFNIQNNNFDTMILSETQQKPVIRKPIVMEGPVIKQTATRRYSDFPASLNSRNNPQQQRQQKLTPVTPGTTPVAQRRFDRQAIYDNQFEAMLVLSVDDILSDQTDLHGAIVLSHRREASSSNNK